MPRGSSPAFSSYPWPDLPISHPAYAPAATSPARYRAGRAKQHNHARNVKPFPPSEESEAGSARCLVRPIFLCCSLYHAPGLFPCLFILPLAGPASHPAYAPAATSPARYRAGRAKQHHHARNVKPLPPSEESGENPPRAGGGEGGHLPVPLAFFASFWQKKEETPFLYAL